MKMKSFNLSTPERFSSGVIAITAGLSGLWLIFMHLCWPNHGGNGTDLPGNLLAWCFISIPCVLFWGLHSGKKRIHLGPTILWLLVGAILMSLPLLWSPSSATFHNALPRIAGLWAGMAFLFTLRQCIFTPQQRLLLLYCLALAGGIEAAITLAELYGPISWLPQVWQKLVNKYGRSAISVFQQVNLAASFLALSLATALLLFGMRYGTLAGRKYEYARLSILACIIIIISATLTLIYSRTGWLAGVLVVFGVYALFTYSRFREEGQYQWWLLLLPVIGVALGLGLMNLSIAEALNAHKGSNSQRLLTLCQTFYYALHHPFIGYGAGTYEGYYQAWLAALPGGNPGTEVMSYPHNELLYQFTEGGLVSLAGVLCWCGLYIRLWLRMDTVLQAGALLAILPVFLHTQVEYPLYYSVIHWLTLLVLIRLADKECPDKTPENSDHSRLSMLIPAGMFILAMYGAVISFQAYRTGQILDRFENNEMINPKQIAQLNVPWIHHLRYQQDLTLLRLIRYQTTPDKASLLAFTQENAQWLSVHAWFPLYENQISVFRFLHENSQAERWLKQAKLTMPWKFKISPSDPPPPDRRLMHE